MYFFERKIKYWINIVLIKNYLLIIFLIFFYFHLNKYSKWMFLLPLLPQASVSCLLPWQVNARVCVSVCVYVSEWMDREPERLSESETLQELVESGIKVKWSVSPGFSCLTETNTAWLCSNMIKVRKSPSLP